MQPKTVAIVGGGATATTFIRALISECLRIPLRINLIIFEPAMILGTGNAYQKDFASSIINRPAQSMSANAQNIEEFFHWAEAKQVILTEPLKNPEKPIYTSRTLFGEYLSEMLEAALDQAEQYGINVTIIKEKVTNITQPRLFALTTHTKRLFIADYVILCTGHNQPSDIYHLKNTPRYIHDPYPLYKQLKLISAHDTIGIIGNSLTAIDIALALQRNNHHGEITMMSRQYVIPRVRGKIGHHTLKYFTEAAITALQKAKGELSLRDGLRLLRKELRYYGEPWKFLFREDAKNVHLAEMLVNEIQAARQERPWQALMTSTNDVVECLWQALSHSAKVFFLKHYQRIWLSYRTPIPLINARRLLHLVRKHQLTILVGLTTIQYDHDKQQYSALVNQKSYYSFDWIINATGPARYVQPEDTLLSKLISHGLAIAHPLGGINVDFNSAALIGINGQPNNRIRLLGHNTTGVYQYTASLEMIAKKSQTVAHQLAEFIRKMSHDNHQPITTPHFDRASHFA